jgi:hypothetical protein
MATGNRSLGPILRSELNYIDTDWTAIDLCLILSSSITFKIY